MPIKLFVTLAALASISGTNTLLSPSLHTGQEFTAVALIGFDNGQARNEVRALENVTVESIRGDLVEYGASSEMRGEKSTQKGFVNVRTLQHYDQEQRPKDSGDPTTLIYDPLYYGAPPAHLALGSTWRVKVSPWSMGPAGEQTVKVSAIDEGSKTISLDVAGSGNGLSKTQIDHPESLVVHMHGAAGPEVSTRLDVRGSVWHIHAKYRAGILQNIDIKVSSTELLPATSMSSKMSHTAVRTFKETVTSR